jgi:signal transduction histidine kinase
MANRTTDCTILLVDDEEANLDLLEGCLRADGFHRLVRTSDAREAAPLFQAEQPDLVLLDLHMPFRDGFELLRHFGERTPDGDYLPVLVLTADITPDAKRRALSGGARDFLTKPFDLVEVSLRVRNLLETRLLHLHQREQRERAEGLAAENARLFAGAQEATRARDRMLSVVAHDLRNPLALVAMNAEMLDELLSPRASAYQREMVQIIQHATDRMQRLIEDLLDVSRLEHGTFTLHRSPTRPAELLAETEQMLRSTAQAQDVVLEVRCDDGLPPADVDGARLLQVLSNLGSNALKFSRPGGRVVITCECSGEELHFAVVDSGQGIPAAEIPHLFRAFWQARQGDPRGVGLGLWIAHSIVEAHAGRIWVESVENEGSTFHFSVPIAESRVETPAVPAPDLSALVMDLPADVTFQREMGQVTHAQ